jgi:hypothetical protein
LNSSSISKEDLAKNLLNSILMLTFGAILMFGLLVNLDKILKIMQAAVAPSKKTEQI